jgi:hypothetical protein
MDDLKKNRAALKKKWEANRAASPDSVPISEADKADDANPRHLEDFTRLVDVAARKRQQDDQT